jgi:hypothetical protein
VGSRSDERKRRRDGQRRGFDERDCPECDGDDGIQRREMELASVPRIQIEIRENAADESAEQRRWSEIGRQNRNGERKRHPDQRVCRQHHTPTERDSRNITSPPDVASRGCQT